MRRFDYNPPTSSNPISSADRNSSEWYPFHKPYDSNYTSVGEFLIKLRKAAKPSRLGDRQRTILHRMITKNSHKDT